MMIIVMMRSISIRNQHQSLALLKIKLMRSIPMSLYSIFQVFLTVISGTQYEVVEEVAIELGWEI